MRYYGYHLALGCNAIIICYAQIVANTLVMETSSKAMSYKCHVRVMISIWLRHCVNAVLRSFAIWIFHEITDTVSRYNGYSNAYCITVIEYWTQLACGCDSWPGGASRCVVGWRWRMKAMYRVLYVLFGGVKVKATYYLLRWRYSSKVASGGYI